MTKLLLLIITCSILAACSSKQVQMSEAQYCYTKENIVIKNGQTVDSKTTVQCSDTPAVEHVVKDEGLASDCRISKPLVRDNNPEYGDTLLCKFTDPTGKTVWRPVNESFAYPSLN